MKKISLLGATGSIGTQTLEVISMHPDKFSLEAVSFGQNISLGLEIIHKYTPKVVSVLTKEDQLKVKQQVSSNVNVVYGNEGLIEVATYYNSDILVNAVIGSVGLEPTLAAIEANKTIAIANKETLVTAGHLVMEKARKHNVSLLPVDSEHSAIFQCLQGEKKEQLSKIILTASGGSFRDKSRDELHNVTVESALNHPNWSMGAKITIDSATMMNKGLEVIEARWLFDIDYQNIDVLLHKESIIHSMVEYQDGSIIAHLGTPDMKVPIQYALSHPDRIQIKDTKRLNLAEVGQLNFSNVDYNRYRCLYFAFEAGKVGGTMPTVLNAANEAAVSMFLNKKISFLEIEDLIEKALEQHQAIPNPDLKTIQIVDAEARKFVQSNVS